MYIVNCQVKEVLSNTVTCNTVVIWYIAQCSVDCSLSTQQYIVVTYNSTIIDGTDKKQKNQSQIVRWRNSCDISIRIP